MAERPDTWRAGIAQRVPPALVPLVDSIVDTAVALGGALTRRR